MTMQIMMADAAHGRIADRLVEFGPELDVLTLGADGTVRRGPDVLPEAFVDPEVFWISADLFRSGQLQDFLGRILRGRRARWAQVFLAGLDNPVFGSIMARGVRLTKSSAQAPAIAEFVLCHALSLLHPIAEQRLAQDERKWRYLGFREIAATRWLLVGFGAIGLEIAHRARPFGVHLTAIRRRAGPSAEADVVRPTEALLASLPDADVVILACALNSRTRGIAGADFFRAMKPGSLLINIARGALVDDDALRAGLDRGQPRHAVLDAFSEEPLPTDSWLWAHPAVRVTAHCSNAGDGVQDRGDALFLENLRRYLARAPLLNEADIADTGA
jgi:phosphoglycerate dehydrogenase-like enzyme